MGLRVGIALLGISIIATSSGCDRGEKKATAGPSPPVPSSAVKAGGTIEDFGIFAKNYADTLAAFLTVVYDKNGVPAKVLADVLTEKVTSIDFKIPCLPADPPKVKTGRCSARGIVRALAPRPEVPRLKAKSWNIDAQDKQDAPEAKG